MSGPQPPVDTRFKTGNPGRPEGARSKLGKTFINAMMKDFEAYGAPTIVLARMEDPLGYIKVIASLLPKELMGENGEALFTGITVNFVKPGDRSKP